MLFMLVFDRQGPSRFWTWEYLAYTIFLVKCINFCHGTVNMKVVYPNESMWLHLFCLVCDYTSSVLYVITRLLSCMWLHVFCLVCDYTSSVLYVITRLLSCMWLHVFCLVCDYTSSVLYVITRLLSCMWLHLFCLVCDYTSSVYVITRLLSCMWLRLFCLVCDYASSVLYVVTRLLSCMWLRVFCLVCGYASSVLYVITRLLSCMWLRVFCLVCDYTSSVLYAKLHRLRIPIYIQQDATLHSLFISGNCSTCFGWYLHPSSGAHTTVSTASGISHAIATTCRYRGKVGRVPTLARWRQVAATVWLIPDAVDTVVCAPDDGWRYM